MSESEKKIGARTYGGSMDPGCVTAIANWCENNGISVVADIDPWCTANITTLVQARGVLADIMKILFLMARRS